MKKENIPSAFRRAAAFAALLLLSSALSSFGADRHKIVNPVPGGISPTPDIISQVLSNGEMKLEWNGFAGPYDVQGLIGVGRGRWTTLGTTNGKSITISPGLSSIFRIRGAAPEFGTAEACAECHSDTHGQWMDTIHARAHDSIRNIGQGDNPACVTCHTIGAGTPNGYKTFAATPYFANVQCESCHGPSAMHMANPENPALRPIVTDSSKLCGGCHNGFHHPTYDEWAHAGHARVDSTVQSYFRDPAAGQARMQACGACHSGAVRLAMMKTVKGGTLQLPSGETAATTAVTCAVCHDAHKPNLDNTHSLRNPRHSTAFFSYDTGTNTNFKIQWEAGGKDIQICGQCHNSRGAKPSDTSRPPHHSPQYNMLVADVGETAGYVPLAAPANRSAHRTIQDQCTRCHTHKHGEENPTEENPVYTGHGFEPSIESCTECHQTAQKSRDLMTSTQAEIRQQIQEVKALLDNWANTKSPEALRAKYGSLAWEYNTAGQISNPSGTAGVRGPTAAEQADVPMDIKRARYWLYMVEHDGSYGVHNAKYARFLLSNARTNVQVQLAKP